MYDINYISCFYFVYFFYCYKVYYGYFNSYINWDIFKYKKLDCLYEIKYVVI